MVKYCRLLGDDTGDDRTSIWINLDALSWWVLHILKKMIISSKKNNDHNDLLLPKYFKLWICYNSIRCYSCF
jgi:hypothetical protein